EFDRAGRIGGGQGIAVGREGDCVDRAGMSFEDVRDLLVFRIPEQYRVGRAHYGQLRWVARRKGHGADLVAEILFQVQDAQFLPGYGVPDPHGPVQAARGDDITAVRSERYGSDRASMRSEYPQGLGLHYVPQPHRLVIAAGGEPGAVR